jgi:hypothetical protein
MVKWLLLLLAGCDIIEAPFKTNEFSGDPYPIRVDTRSGAVLAGLEAVGTDHIAVVDILSPLTLIDPGADVEPTIAYEDLFLLGERDGGVGMPTLPRARFLAQQTLHLHPCSLMDEFCKLGSPTFELQYDAIVGADALAGDALRMRLGDDQLFVLADIGGSDDDRTHACDAVFPSPFHGGGTLVVAGTEVPFAGRRVTMQVCLGQDPREIVAQIERGTDAFFVMSSSIGVSILSESGWERYRQGHITAPPLITLPETTLALPSGTITGHLATIDRLALVAHSSSDPRSPCRQVYAHHFLTDRDCIPNVDDCPCKSDSEQFCSVPAVVEVAPALGIDILIVRDDNDTLQALRTELRPNQQEVDGILGTNTLRDIELDVDYPHGRALARCSSDFCLTRSALGSQSDRARVKACME